MIFKKRKCTDCKKSYEPSAGHQKFCSKKCRGKNFIKEKKEGVNENKTTRNVARNL